MDPDIWPLDRAATAALVVRVIDDVDVSSEEDRDQLLSELLCSAWGTVWAQNQ